MKKKKKLFRLCWQLEGRKDPSKGQILKHQLTEKPFTRAEANECCNALNVVSALILGRQGAEEPTRYWIEEGSE